MPVDDTMGTPLDLAIVGGGPAGLSALLGGSCLKLRAAAFDDGERAGGQLLRVYNRVADYLGLECANGAGLAAAFERQVLDAGGSLLGSARVQDLDCSAGTLVAGGRIVRWRHLLVATGVRPRTLGVPGEREFMGLGVSPSATRDVAKFAGKRVVVIGGGDAALEEALILASVCEHVTIVHRRRHFTARADFRERVAAERRIDCRFATELRAVLGDAHVRAVALTSAESAWELAVEGVFVCAGVEPNTAMVTGQVELDERGYVVVDATGRTSRPNVYAAGDVTAGSSLTIAAAVGQGAAVAKDVQRRLVREEVKP